MKSRLLFAALSIVCGIATSVSVSAQAQQEPRFDVATVRLWDKTSSVSRRVTDTRLDFTNVTLRSGLLYAYGIPDYRLVGPEWLDQIRVDIRATIPAGASRQRVPEMLRRLLVERFGVVAHRELRLIDGFELARDGKAIAMREVAPLDEFDKVLPPDLKGSAVAQVLADSVVETPDGPERRLVGRAGVTIMTQRTMYSLRGVTRPGEPIQVLEATRMTMAELAALLTTNTGQPVVDRTGLAGGYQFRLELPLNAKALALERRAGLLSSDPASVSAFRAVKALGLTLDARRLSIDAVVVDKIERVPTEQ